MLIFFDIDRTLFDQDTAEQKGAIYFLNEHKDILPYSEDQFVKLWNKLLLKHYERYLAKELTYLEQRRERIKELFSYVNSMWMLWAVRVQECRLFGSIAMERQPATR
jgi:FMN phosphatase YigB (HAD superfamily)